MTDDDQETTEGGVVAGFRIGLGILGAAIGITVLVGGLVFGANVLLFEGGAPCDGGESPTVPGSVSIDETPPDAVAVTVTENSRFTRQNTDAVTVVVANAETAQTYRTNWSVHGTFPLTGGDELRLSDGQVPFTLTPADTVTVRWTGYESGLATYCPNRERERRTLAEQ